MGLANYLRDGVGMERKRTKAWRIVDRTDGGRGRDRGQGERIVGVGVHVGSEDGSFVL